MSKPKPERVDAWLARGAMERAKIRPELFTQYIMGHYRRTGDLAPRCDFKDLLAWYEIHMPGELAAITGIKAGGGKHGGKD